MKSKIAISLICVSVCSGQEQDIWKSRFEALDARYMAESRFVGQDRSIDPQPYYERWLSEFQGFAEQAPNGWYRDRARMRVVAALNSLARPKDSVEVLQTLVDEERRKESEQSALFSTSTLADYLNQLGEASYSAAVLDRDESWARKSIDSFAEMREVLPVPCAAAVIGLSKSATLEGKLLGNRQREAELQLAAFETWRKLPKHEQRSDYRSQGESILGNAVVAFAEADQPEKALELLTTLEDFTLGGEPHRRALNNLLAVGSQRRKSDYVDYAEAWVQRHPKDSTVPSILLRVGSFHAVNSPKEKAVQFLDQAVASAEQGIGRLSDLQWMALQSQYSHLGRLYESGGDTARAAEMRERISKLPRRADK